VDASPSDRDPVVRHTGLLTGGHTGPVTNIREVQNGNFTTGRRRYR
jgi:hypothetical protein